MFRITLAHLARTDERSDQKSWDADSVTLCDDLLKMHGYGSIGELIEYTINLKDDDNYRLIITKESEG